MIRVDNLTINIHTPSTNEDEVLKTQSPVVVRDELVSMLRLISKDERFLSQTVLIPEDCEKYGFVQGDFDLPTLLHFLADMLE